MRIEKSATPQFENYDIFIVEECRWSWLSFLVPEVLHKVTHVLEADDVSGLIVRQVINENSEPIYTNGSEDIAMSNEARLLLMVPPIQQAFLSNGFRPKTVTTYERNVRIVNRNPTVAIAVNVQQELETQNA